MTKSSTNYENISRIVLAVISLSLSLFLISLGDKILSDITKIYTLPEEQEYISKDSLKIVISEIKNVNAKIDGLTESKERYEKAYESASAIYQSEKESFDAWIKTRKTIGSPEQDKDVLSRTHKLDELRLVRDQWLARSSESDLSINQLKGEKKLLVKSEDIIKNAGNEKYESELKSYTLKVFFIRLLFALPILAIGIFLVVKFRKSKYNSFVWGYSLFSLYIFFIGLVPYLPSYGGYVRYIVGITLTIFIGYYVIKQLSLYTERKKQELSKSTEERSKEIVYTIAAKAFESQTCPSCERKYNIVINATDKSPNYCIHCGLKLFGKCTKCDQRNFVHFPYCSSCGSSISIDKTV